MFLSLCRYNAEVCGDCGNAPSACFTFRKYFSGISPPRGMKVRLIFLYNTKPKNFPLISKILDLNCRLWVSTQFNSWFTLFQQTFLKFFGGHKSFSWGHWYPCFGLLVGFKAGVEFSLAYFLACVLFLRFTSSATPADFIDVSIAAKPFDPHTCRCVCKCWWRIGARTHDRPMLHAAQQARRCKTTVSTNLSDWPNPFNYQTPEGTLENLPIRGGGGWVCPH